MDKISAPIIEESEGIDSKLAAVGMQPKDIEHIFISHMDFDHTGGLRLVKDAQDIRCSEDEWAACNKFSLRYMTHGRVSVMSAHLPFSQAASAL